MNNELGVPDYRVDAFAPRSSRWAVFVFVINEGERGRGQLRQMAALREPNSEMFPDILVADGGSTDGSLDPIFLRGVSVRALLTKQSSGALSTQMRMAFNYALKEGYEGVIVIDGNGKDGVETIPRFVEALQQGYDHVQGSRYLSGGFHENTPFLRHWAVNLFHAPLVSLAARFHYTDTTNGFRAYSARLLQDPRLAIFRPVFRAYELHYYLAIEAPRLGFRGIEIPVSRRYPKGAVPSKIKGWKGNIKVLLTLLECCFHKYRLPRSAQPESR
jgi:dolichol-phosphate mannosyltransferase